MDKNEIIAIGIVIVAAIFAIYYLIKQKGGACCSKDCLKPKEPKEKQ
jgi:hypothetical protein